MTEIRRKSEAGPALPAWASIFAPALALAVYALVAGLWIAGQMDIYNAVLAGFGMYHLTPPFLDTHAILSAVQCHAAGIDVTLVNPCDIQQRPHVYGSLWLRLSAVGLDLSMTNPVGMGLDLAFLAGLFVLPRARRWRDVLALSVAFVSPVVVLALERANSDLVVWVLALIAVQLLAGSAIARFVAYCVGCLAALLKFYPAVLLMMVARERLARALAIGLPLGTALVVLLWRESRTPLKTFHYTAYMTDAFGAWNIGEALLASQSAEAWQRQAMVVLVLALAAYALSLSVRMTLRFGLLARVRALHPTEAWLALAGSAMLIACFFAGPSLVYRAIHLLLVLPAVLSLWRNADDRPGRLLFAGLAWVIIWCLWSEVAHNHMMHALKTTDVLTEAQLVMVGAVTGLRELAWWWLVSVMAALAACVALTSRAGEEFCRLAGIRLDR